MEPYSRQKTVETPIQRKPTIVYDNFFLDDKWSKFTLHDLEIKSIIRSINISTANKARATSSALPAGWYPSKLQGSVVLTGGAFLSCHLKKSITVRFFCFKTWQ